VLTDLQIGLCYKEACLSAILSMNLTSEPYVGPLASPTVLTDLWMGLRYKEVWLSAILNLTSEPSVGPLASPPMLAGLQVCPRQVGGL
jgi:hypothetical protein